MTKPVPSELFKVILKSELEKVQEEFAHCSRIGTSLFTMLPDDVQVLEFPVCTLMEQSLMNADRLM
jgi:hypothetical protein